METLNRDRVYGWLQQGITGTGKPSWIPVLHRARRYSYRGRNAAATEASARFEQKKTPREGGRCEI